MFINVTDQKDTQITWRSWIDNVSLLHMMVISHLDMINIQKQMLSAGQWILWWKASAQWKVSFWFCVSLSKTLPWFDTAYQRPLGWAEWQCNLWTCTDSASQTVLRPSPWEARILRCRFSQWIQNVMRAVWPKRDVFQRITFFCCQSMWTKNRPAYLRLWILSPPSYTLIF